MEWIRFQVAVANRVPEDAYRDHLLAYCPLHMVNLILFCLFFWCVLLALQPRRPSSPSFCCRSLKKNGFQLDKDRPAGVFGVASNTSSENPTKTDTQQIYNGIFNFVKYSIIWVVILHTSDEFFLKIYLYNELLSF